MKLIDITNAFIKDECKLSTLQDYVEEIHMRRILVNQLEYELALLMENSIAEYTGDHITLAQLKEALIDDIKLGEERLREKFIKQYHLSGLGGGDLATEWVDDPRDLDGLEPHFLYKQTDEMWRRFISLVSLQ